MGLIEFGRVHSVVGSRAAQAAFRGLAGQFFSFLFFFLLAFHRRVQTEQKKFGMDIFKGRPEVLRN